MVTLHVYSSSSSLLCDSLVPLRCASSLLHARLFSAPLSLAFVHFLRYASSFFLPGPVFASPSLHLISSSQPSVLHGYGLLHHRIAPSVVSAKQMLVFIGNAALAHVVSPYVVSHTSRLGASLNLGLCIVVYQVVQQQHLVVVQLT